MAGPRTSTIEGMNEKRFYADVELPFHVWVREGNRWVLREARAEGEASYPAATPTSTGPNASRPSRPSSSGR